MDSIKTVKKSLLFGSTFVSVLYKYVFWQILPFVKISVIKRVVRKDFAAGENLTCFGKESGGAVYMNSFDEKFSGCVWTRDNFYSFDLIVYSSLY